MILTRTIVAAAIVGLLVACASPEEKAAAYVARAQQLYDAGDYEQAALEVRNAAQVEPKNGKARYLLALLAEQKEDYKGMFNHLLVAVDADPSNIEARLKLAMVFVAIGDWVSVTEQSQALLKLVPEDPRVIVLQARVDLQNGNLSAGRAGLEKAIELDPVSIDPVLVLGTLEGADDLDRGLVVLDAGIARMPVEKSRRLREQRILLLASKNRIKEVEEGLRALTKDFPDNSNYPDQLARMLAAQGRPDDADKVYQQLIEIDPEDAVRRSAYVGFLVRQQQREKAEEFLLASIAALPDIDALRLALGNLYEGNDQFDDAKAAYQDLAARSPKSVDGVKGRIRIAVIESTAGNGAAAMKVVDALLIDIPDEPTALLLRAGSRLQGGNVDEAIADLRVVTRKEPENVTAMLMLAEAHKSKNELAVAKDLYRQVLNIQPDSAVALRELVNLYVAGQEYTEAEQMLTDRVKRQPDDVLASRALVDLLLSQGKKDQAAAEAQRMAALPSQGGLGELSMGRVLAEQQDYDAAAEAFRKSMAAGGGNDPLAIEGLVRALNAAGKRQEALALLKQLKAGTGEDNAAFSDLLLADIYGQSGDRAEAVKALESAIKARPEIADGYLQLARLYADDPAAQIKIYQRGMTALPGNAYIGLPLAVALEEAGQYEAMITSLESLHKANPAIPQVTNNLAMAILDHRSDAASYQRASELARKLESSNDPLMLDTVGWSYYRAGEFAQAASVLERVVAKDDRVPVYHYHLGMAYLAMGNQVGAQQQLEKAVTGDAQYVGIDEARAALAKLGKPAPGKTAAATP
ncbi:MAG: tetratricopeptide repeat protein [Gammaproteobacteria bacterium]